MKHQNTVSALIGLIALAFSPVGTADAAERTTAPRTLAPVSGGTIEGRVSNPASGEFLQNAEVRIEGTDIRVSTQADGRYRIANAPAGRVQVTVKYTGYKPASAEVEVERGQIAQRNFELQSTHQPDVVALDRFTVSAEREGTAKALMEQRSAMTVKNVVATDTFGAIVEGNVGDVLQYVPGLQILYSADVAATVSIGGMDAKYGSLMIDGVRTSGATREPALGSYSAYATDTIEVNKTNSAEMDADAPAGSINLRSKSAFQRQGRFFSWEVYSIYNTYNPLTLGRTNGPNDGRSHPLNPSVVLDYSDVYLDGKLGVVVNLSETNSTSGSGFLNFTYNRAPTVSRPEPILLTQLLYGKGAIILKRRGGGLNVEYKLTPALTLALRGQAAWEEASNYNKQFTITGARASLGAGSNENVFIGLPTTNNANRFALAGGLTRRIRNTHSLIPQIRYDGKKVSFDASLSYMRQSDYRKNLREDGIEVGSANMQLFGVGWIAERTDPGDTAFEFQQTAGPDLYDIDNWRATSLTNNIVKAPNEPTTRRYLGQFNIKYDTDWTRPTFFKAGLKTTAGTFFNTVGNSSWTYVGATGNRLEADIPVSVAPFDPHTGGNLFDRHIPHPDRTALGHLLQDHPEYFVSNPAEATNASNLRPIRESSEYIDSGYVMANTQFGRLTAQGGIRYERTESQGKTYERDLLVTRIGKYDDVFFSGALRYRFSENMRAIASFSQSIQRVNLNGLSGVLSINDTNMTGSLPNPELKPEHGNNYSIRIERYFEPAGTFSIGVFQFDITDLQKSVPGQRAEDIGLGDDYPGYTFTSLSNVGDFTNKGIELAYSQQLTFLPGVFRGLGVFANYNQFTRSNPELAYRAAPKAGSAGISFRYRRLNLALRGAWQDEMLQNIDAYTRPSLYMGATLNIRLTKNTSFTLTGRNILNQERLTYERANRGLARGFEIQGASWVFGLKGIF